MTLPCFGRHCAALALLALSATAVYAQAPAPPASTTPPAATPPATAAKPIPMTASEKAQAEIQAILDKKNAAIAKKDMVGGISYLAPDFIGIASNGTKMSYAQIRAASLGNMDAIDSIEVTDNVDTVALKGNTATVDMTETQKATIRQPNGITRTLNVQSTSRCFWVKGKNGWQMKRSRVLQGGIDVDGKPVRVATPG